MPKKNPKEKGLKHNPKLSKKKSQEEPKRPYEEDQYEYSKNYTPLYMIIAFVSIVLVIVLLFVFVFNTEAELVQKYDDVNLDYDIYTLEQYEDHEDPEIHKTDVWVNCCSRYDDDCEKGLIQGFYEKLLGKREGDVINFELIEACRDKDEDGEDDATGDDALSYGFEDDELYDTDIVLWAKILKIKKASAEKEEDTESYISYYSSNGILNMIETLYYVLFNKSEMYYIPKLAPV